MAGSRKVRKTLSWLFRQFMRSQVEKSEIGDFAIVAEDTNQSTKIVIMFALTHKVGSSVQLKDFRHMVINLSYELDRMELRSVKIPVLGNYYGLSEEVMIAEIFKVFAHSNVEVVLVHPTLHLYN